MSVHVEWLVIYYWQCMWRNKVGSRLVILLLPVSLFGMCYFSPSDVGFHPCLKWEGDGKVRKNSSCSGSFNYNLSLMGRLEFWSFWWNWHTWLRFTLYSWTTGLLNSCLPQLGTFYRLLNGVKVHKLSWGPHICFSLNLGSIAFIGVENLPYWVFRVLGNLFLEFSDAGCWMPWVLFCSIMYNSILFFYHDNRYLVTCVFHKILSARILVLTWSSLCQV